MPRPKRIETIICIVCSQTFNAPFWRHRTVCSFACRNERTAAVNSARKKHPREGFQKGHRTNVGEKSPHWKGDKVGYAALHDWIVRCLGQPDACSHCLKSGLKGKQIHWANKSQQYRRDLNDWIRLCARCHKKYDEHLKKPAVRAYAR